MTGILNILAGALGVAKDTYFNLVSLLLPGNGTNGANNNFFLDSSSNNFTITRNPTSGPNAPTQGTFSPFSQTGWGNYFNGSSNYRLTIPDSTDLDIPGDFCLEMWAYFTSTSGSNQLVCIGSESAAQNGFVFYQTNTSEVLLYTNGAGAITTSGAGITANRWYHIALVRSGTGAGNTVIYVDGVSRGSAQITTSFTGLAGNGLAIGQTYSGSYVGVLNAYLSNVRLVNGSPVYTGPFTPPTTPLTAITNTKLLTCQSNRFVDANTQVTAKTITVTGSPSVVAFSPFAPTAAYTTAAVGGSGYFDGTGDYLATASDAAFGFGTGDFTVEAWVYMTGGSGERTLFCVDATGGANIFLSSANQIGIGRRGLDVNNTFGASPVSNAWAHVAIARSGTSITCWVNGAVSGTQSQSNSINYSSGPANIGAIATYAGQNFAGYMGSYRIVKGTAVYNPSSSTITVPTAPLTAITNTSLLLNFTNAGITDATAKNDLETVGNAQISTSVSKFGGGSIAFDGSGDWLIAPPTQNLALGSGDFTIETWIYPIAYSGSSIYPILIANGSADAAAAGEFSFYINHPVGSTIIYFNTSGTGQSLSGGSIVATGGWSHVAISRSSGTLRVFINGAQQYSGACTASFGLATNQTTIGVRTGNTAQTSFNGYMDDLRITRGLARYTANFTPPTAPFPVQ